MNSYNVQVHGMTDSQMRRAKKSWSKPLIEIIALKTAECGNGNQGPDGNAGCHIKSRS